MMMRRIQLGILMIGLGTTTGAADVGERCWVPDVDPVPSVQWTSSEGGNGHWYAVVHNDAAISWELARAQAVARGGDLVSITGSAENTFVFSLLADDMYWEHDGPWIGLSREAGGSGISLGWALSDGTPASWMPWGTGFPAGTVHVDWNAHYSVAQRAEMKWSNSLSGPQTGTHIHSYVMEWDSLPDCNENQTDDLIDILYGVSEDMDGDGQPDECQCHADADDSGSVDILDVLSVLDQWGEDGPSGDVDYDGVVGLSDLLAVLQAWGSCETD